MAKSETDLKEQVSTVVRSWVVDRLHNSPVAQHTDAWNHIYSVLPDLEERLAEAFARP